MLPLLQSRRRFRAGAFTLIELLVVMGMIAILIAILVPMVHKSRRTAQRTKAAADLQAISAALEQYKIDHGDYPRVLDNLVGDPGNVAYLNGAQVLCRALIAPGPGFRIPASTIEVVNDGAGMATDPQLAEPGFRIRSATQGRVYGPYLKANLFKLGPPPQVPAVMADPLNFNLVILDAYDNPIHYFPARLGVTNLSTVGVYYIGLGETDRPLFDRSDCLLDNGTTPFLHDGDAANTIQIARFHLMMGDYDGDGQINTAAGEVAKAQNKPYLLWSAGSDQLYGPRAEDAAVKSVLEKEDADACDDVTNFIQ